MPQRQREIVERWLRAIAIAKGEPLDLQRRGCIQFLRQTVIPFERSLPAPNRKRAELRCPVSETNLDSWHQTHQGAQQRSALRPTDYIPIGERMQRESCNGDGWVLNQIRKPSVIDNEHTLMGPHAVQTVNSLRAPGSMLDSAILLYPA